METVKNKQPVERQTESSLHVVRSYAGMVKIVIFPASSDFWGIILSPFKENPILCKDSGDFLLKLSQLLAELGFPMANYEYRSFVKKSQTRQKQEKPTLYHDPGDMNPFEQIRRAIRDPAAMRSSKKCVTFLVQVLYRQHASIQGIIVWNSIKKSFRSGMELLHLISAFERYSI